MAPAAHQFPAPARRGPAPAVGAMLAVCLLAASCGRMVDVAPLATPSLPQSARTSVVEAADGSLLARLHAEQDRDPVPLRAIPAILRAAVVTVEDRRFYGHSGVDARALARAFVHDARTGTAAQGGSTITQQLIKNLGGGDEPSLRRKLSEAALAWQLETRLPKSAILQRYLNTVYFGQGAYGVAAAARTYFGVPLDSLDVSQAALLAGMLQAPSSYDPYRRPGAARGRRDVVLALLRDAGRISPRAYAAARATPLEVVPPTVGTGWRAPYFVDHVLALLQHDPAFAVLGTDARARAHRLFAGGLRIRTTLDPVWQAAAEAAVRQTLTEVRDPRGALVGMDPRTGAIRALVGGRDHDDPTDPSARFNLATQALRQPGSAFKAVVLATALAQGHRLGERFPGGAGVKIPMPAGQPPWLVRNYDGADLGPLTLLDATASSVNVAYARLVTEVGAEAVAQTARAAGVTRPLRPLPSIALGAQEVTPLEMATVMATLAAGGVHRAPLAVTRITTDGGRVLYRRDASPARRVLDSRAAALTTRALARVVTAGTGRRADLRRPTAGKTGTTTDGADAWFTGYTPDLAAAVWIGFPSGRVPMQPPRTRIRVEGGNWPAEVFARFGLRALGGVPAAPFPAPPPLADDRRVPEVTGLPVAAARRVLEGAGGTVRIRPVPAASLPPGYVAAQSPAGGTTAHGPVVATLDVATGAPSQPVPDVLGMAVAKAREALAARDLAVRVRRGCPDGASSCTGATQMPGRVWESVPDRGAVPTAGEPVTLSAYPG